MELRQDILARRDLITNPKAQRIHRLAGLSRRSFRIKHNLTIIEAPNAIREALSFATAYIRDIYIAANQIEQHQAILELALSKDCYIHPVTPAVLAAFTEAPQGIAASFELSFFRDAKLPGQGKAKLGIALPCIQDPGNLGSIIRAADACGAQYVVVCKGSTDPFSPKVIRSSAGSIFHLPIIYSPELEDFQQIARVEKISLVGTTVQGGKSLPDFIEQVSHNENLCWVLGNEANGLSLQEIDCCDNLVSIPLKGQAESFNVASAAVIMLYESSQKLY